MHRVFVFSVCVTFAFLAALPLAGCGRGQGAAASDDVRIDLRLGSAPAVVGPAEVTIDLASIDGRPIDGASVEVEGTMSHAGMVPVFAAAASAGPGRYVTRDFRFTMGGDWILIVRAKLPDGRQVERAFDVKGVAGGHTMGR